MNCAGPSEENISSAVDSAMAQLTQSFPGCALVSTSLPSAIQSPRYIRELTGWQHSSVASRSAAMRQLTRHNEADLHPVTGLDDERHYKKARIDAYHEMSERRGCYERHRDSERRTAEYFRNTLYPATGNSEYRDIAAKLSDCRQSGVYGYSSCGSLMVAWDDKCNLARLCPDEAAAESQRLEQKYSGIIAAESRGGRRVYKAVFTLKNYPEGRLAEGKKHIFTRFRDRVLRSVKNGSKRFPVVGALVIQEDPLSARGDWNIHLNVILITEGRLDFKDLRQHWGAQIDIRQHQSLSPAGLHRLFAECVKYAVQCIPAKSQGHADSGTSDAPALIQWPPSSADEWWQAGKGFRRTRGYGCLYGKSDIAKAHEALTRMKLGSVRWVGRIEYGPDGRYALDFGQSELDLIRGHKSPDFETVEQWDRYCLDAGPPI